MAVEAIREKDGGWPEWWHWRVRNGRMMDLC